jgi:hypothetical protein
LIGLRVASPLAAPAIVLGCLGAALLTWLALPPASVESWMGESGPVERVTAATYALCAVAVWLLRRPNDDWRTSLALCTVMLCFCMRELDWHKAFTGTSVLRASWYTGPAPLPSKLLAALVVFGFAAALAWLVLRHARVWWRGLRERRAVAVTMLMFIVALLLAKSLDRSASILETDFGVHVALKWKALRTAFEEWLELGLSLLLLLGLAQHRAAARAATIDACASPPTSSSPLPSRLSRSR